MLSGIPLEKDLPMNLMHVGYCLYQCSFGVGLGPLKMQWTTVAFHSRRARIHGLHYLWTRIHALTPFKTNLLFVKVSLLAEKWFKNSPCSYFQGAAA